jgi:hypothetical protein
VDVVEKAGESGIRVGADLSEHEAEEEAARIAANFVRDCVTECFPAGTLVATTRGEKPIERVQVGDQVLTEDPKTGKVEAEAVQAVRHDPPTWVMAIGLADGSTIEVTPEHPFWVDSGANFVGPGWLQAGDLRIGDQLRTANGTDATVVSLRYHVANVEVYTLTLGQNHDFFTGSARVLVHNYDCMGMATAEAQAATAVVGDLQHAYRHVGAALELGNWDKASGGAFRTIVEDVLTNPESVIRDWTQARGGASVDIYVQTVHSTTLAVFVDRATGRVATVVSASPQQVFNWIMGIH